MLTNSAAQDLQGAVPHIAGAGGHGKVRLVGTAHHKHIHHLPNQIDVRKDHIPIGVGVRMLRLVDQTGWGLVLLDL